MTFFGRILSPLRRQTPADCRSRRFVAVIECLLNQNVRDQGAASFPAINAEVLHLCQERAVGLLQLPCPEIAALGCQRNRPPGQTLRQAMETEASQACCRRLAEVSVGRIRDCLDQGQVLLAILGGNPRSPGCAVHRDAAGRLTAESGVFMTALAAELKRQGLAAGFLPIRDYDAALHAEDLRRLEQCFANPSPPEPAP